jgi:hypothetical protein
VVERIVLLFPLITYGIGTLENLNCGTDTRKRILWLFADALSGSFYLNERLETCAFGALFLFCLLGDLLLAVLLKVEPNSLASFEFTFNAVLLGAVVVTFVFRGRSRGIWFTYAMILGALLFRIPIYAFALGGISWIMLGGFVCVLAILVATRNVKIIGPHSETGVQSMPLGRILLPTVAAALIIMGLILTEKSAASSMPGSVLVGVLLGLLVSAPVSIYRCQTSVVTPSQHTYSTRPRGESLRLSEMSLSKLSGLLKRRQHGYAVCYDCDGPLRWNSINGKWYCDRCRKYTSDMPWNWRI